MLQDIDRNVKSVLSRLGSYQLSDGAFAYWSGNTSGSEWGTVYATHFLIEAAKHGYGVDRAMLDRALKYLRGNPSDYYLTQAYTQYVLALNGTPTRGAMNQLREKAASLSSDAKWLLAAAYALDGNRKVAEGLISLCGDNAEKANPYDGTYNSDERRMSISLMTLTILGRREEAFRMALKMSDILKKDRWLSTQSTAWMLSTLSNFAIAGQTGIDATAGREIVKTDKSIESMPLAAPTEVRNNGSGSLYAVVSQSYTPGKGEETEAASGIRIDVRYTNMDGAAIDPASIRVSTDFYAIVTVSNKSGYERYADLALTHIFPAGWEITSERDLVVAHLPGYPRRPGAELLRPEQGRKQGDPRQADGNLQGALLPAFGLLRGDVRQRRPRPEKGTVGRGGRLMPPRQPGKRSATGKRSRRHLKIYGKTASGIRSRFYFRIRTPGGKTPLNSGIRGTFLR